MKTIAYIDTKHAIEYFGGPTNLAKAAGVIRATIYNWLKKGYIPSEYTSIIQKKAESRNKILTRAFKKVMK